MKGHVAFAALSLLAATPALAQNGAVPGPLGAGTFRRIAAAGDSFEIATSRLALQRSRDPRIQRYAAWMVRDHGLSLAALAPGYRVAGEAAGVAAGAGVGLALGGPAGAAVGAGAGLAAGAPLAGLPPGVALTPNQQAALARLNAARGRRFDRLYARTQVAAHRDTVSLYASYAATGTDPGMVRFANEMLPYLRNHLGRAQRLAIVVGR